MANETPANRMTKEQVDDFLQGSRHAIVSTIRKDGSSQLSPTWYLYEGGNIYIFVPVDSVKYRNLKRDPRISICIDGGHPDARAVMIYGDAEIVETYDDWREEIRFRYVRRYFDNDKDTRAFMAEAASWGPSAIVIVKPSKIVGVDSS